MKKTITFLITLLSTSLIHAMHLPCNQDSIKAYIYTELPRRTANGWILKNDNQEFTEYCVQSSSETLKKYFIFMKKNNHYGYTKSDSPPAGYPNPTTIDFPDKVLSTKWAIQQYYQQLFTSTETEYNQAIQLPIVKDKEEDVFYEYLDRKTIKTYLGYITQKLTKLCPVNNFNPNVSRFISHYALTDEHGIPLDKEFHCHTAEDNKYCEARFDRERGELTLIGSDTDEIKKQFEQLQNAYYR